MKISRREALWGSAGLACSALYRVRGARALWHIAPSPSSQDAELAAKLARDPHHPRFHLLPKANWMNDPNGPVYWQGNYHMFFQYNPDGAYWGDMHWGHAVSPDMIHWRHLPVALAPTPGGPDAAGCFSGTAVIDGGRVTVLYTGVVEASEAEATLRDGVHSFRESQCLAWSDRTDLTRWAKDPRPAIAAPPPGMNVSGFRDPQPWRHGDAWYMAVGSGFRGKGGAVLLYRSKDLRNWEYLHVLAAGAGNGKSAVNPVQTGDMWECPDFFPLGNKYVLIFSSEGKSRWQSGSLDKRSMVFHAEHEGVLDYGAFYAAKTQKDASGNRILWGWIPEKRPENEYRAAGWAGMMSLPRLLTLGRNGDLLIGVAPAVESIRQPGRIVKMFANNADLEKRVSEMRLHAACGEIACVFVAGSEPFRLSLLSDLHGGAPLLNCEYDPSSADDVVMDGRTMPIRVSNGRIRLRFIVDGSVIESFINGQSAYTKRFYYPGLAAPNVDLQLTCSSKILLSLSSSQISPISRDRLTT